MRRSTSALFASVAAAVLVSACAGAPGTPGSPTATYETAASPMPSPSHLPGAAVRITVNGAELKPGATAQLDGEAAGVVVITFPVAMDRASVERWLPRSASISWTDDRTVQLAIPASENNPAFKAPESLSLDGTKVIDLFFVSLSLPPSIVVSTYSVDELLAGAQPPRNTAVRLSAVDERRFSPDGRKVLLYGGVDRPTGNSPRIVDLASRSTVPLAVPEAAGAPLLLGAWAGNDNVVLVGEAVWVGATDGSAMRTVTDLRGLGPPKTAAVSPLGSYVALGWRDRLAIVDLGSGSLRTISGHHDDCDLPGGPFTRLAWSQDERRLAAVECVTSAPTPRVRIVDVASDRAVGTLEGGALGVMSLLTGDLAFARESGEQGQGARRSIVVFSFEGVEKARHLGRAPTLSPDGRYLLDATCCAGEGFVLEDLQAPNQVVRTIGGAAMWLADGRVLVLQRSAGAR